MGDSFITAFPTAILDIIRAVLAFIDLIFYGLLSVIYQIFFNVSSAEIFSGESIMNFFGRIQLILGVFMLFQLTLTILKGVMNPDSFTDQKSGVGNIVQRIAISMILLACIIPISIPNPANEFEKQINNNGLLFGTLYSLQHRVIQNNTLGRLILGTTDDESANYLTGSDRQQLKQAAKIFTSTILRGFIKINLIPEDERVHIEGKEDEMIAENRVCSDSKFDKYIDIYTDINSSPGELFLLVNEKCSPNTSLLGRIFDRLGIKKQYVFVYNGFISTICAVVFIFIFLSLTIDVAVRALKLAILRLISPIPIISYMDPKGGKDGAFNAWVKLLTTTYLDLFIRLAVIYFIIFLIQDMIVHGIVINTTGGIVGGISVILIWIAMFMFAKQAPKFIQEALGIKGGSFSLFGGLASVVGAIGSFRAARQASIKADEVNKVNPSTLFGKALNHGKHLLAGITGGIGGLSAGYEASTGKDGSTTKVLEVLNKRNNDAIAKGEAGSTFMGRVGANMERLLTGTTQAAKNEREINSNKGRIEALKAIKSRMSSEMVKSNDTQGFVRKKNAAGGWDYLMQDTLGVNVEGSINYKDFIARKNAAESAGQAEFKIMTSLGERTIDMTTANLYEGLILKENENNYLQQVIAGTIEDKRLSTLVSNANVLGGSAKFTRNADGTIVKEGNYDVTDRASVTDAIDGFEDYNTQLTRDNAVNKANDRFSGGKSS